MARGGYRPGAGRPKGAVNKKGKKTDRKLKEKPPVTSSIPDDTNDDTKPGKMTPLDYMLKVINEEDADKARRDRMAIAAAPFIHSHKDKGQGKKEDREDRAKAAGAGRFAPSAPPILKMVKK